MDVTDLITLFVHPRLALGLSDRDFTEVGRLACPAGVPRKRAQGVALRPPPPGARVLPQPCGPALGPGRGRGPPWPGAAPLGASTLGDRPARSDRAPRAPQADYEALLRLDDGVRIRQPVSEARIDALPVHVHAAPPRVRRPAGQRAAGRVSRAPPCAPPACPPGRRPVLGASSARARGARQGGGGDGGGLGACSVCLDDFADGAVVRTLPCLHHFHGACVDPWLRQQGLAAPCPVCKTPVFQAP
jgi:hypothetical protein